MTGKYGSLLTVLLIIAIVGIIGLLIFLGIDMYKGFDLDKETKQGAEQFDAIIPDVIEDQIINDVTDNNANANTNTLADANTLDPFAGFENTNTSSSTGTGTGTTDSTKKVVYKGFVQEGTIRIPSTGVQLPVLEVATRPALEVATGIQYGPGLNKVGNTVIAGHNYRNGTLFSNNKNIKLGDKIYIKDTSGTTITYVVYDKLEVSDSETSYINRDTGGKREITLYSCNDDSSKRIVILAKEQ